jgi:catechol 2,3-dioxygenase-like lactoylglutathione lyase family enzyme
MIDSIGGMVVIVSDQQKAIEFYTQKMGFELKSDVPVYRYSFDLTNFKTILEKETGGFL